MTRRLRRAGHDSSLTEDPSGFPTKHQFGTSNARIVKRSSRFSSSRCPRVNLKPVSDAYFCCRLNFGWLSTVLGIASRIWLKFLLRLKSRIAVLVSRQFV